MREILEVIKLLCNKYNNICVPILAPSLHMPIANFELRPTYLQEGLKVHIENHNFVTLLEPQVHPFPFSRLL